MWIVSTSTASLRYLAGQNSKSGECARTHSPARAGLKVGHRYTVEATWDVQEYLVKETALI